MLKPSHQDVVGPQFLEPLPGWEFWRLGENEIRLAGQHLKTERREISGKFVARGNNAREILLIIPKILQRRQRRDLPKPVDIVTVAQLVHCADQRRVSHHVTDALK